MSSLVIDSCRKCRKSASVACAACAALVNCTGTAAMRGYSQAKRHTLSRWGGDLRQTWRTFALRADLGELAASILMNHSLGSVNAGYISTPALRDHLSACQERVSAKIVEAMALPDMAQSFKRDIAAKAQGAPTYTPKQKELLESSSRFFGYDRP